VSTGSCEVGFLLLNNTFVGMFCALQTTTCPIHVWKDTAKDKGSGDGGEMVRRVRFPLLLCSAPSI
jgi:hypothetical protein